MRHATWWQNLIGEVILASLLCGAIKFAAWTADEQVPLWGFCLAAFVGVLRWHAVTFKDIDRGRT